MAGNTEGRANTEGIRCEIHGSISRKLPRKSSFFFFNSHHHFIKNMIILKLTSFSPIYVFGNANCHKFTGAGSDFSRFFSTGHRRMAQK
jgi:hypothetical protein